MPWLKDELSIEQKRGIITLLPKKGQNRQFLKSWRHISLLNTDYKILANILAKVNHIFMHWGWPVSDKMTRGLNNIANSHTLNYK